MFHDAMTSRIFANVHDNPVCILCRQVCFTKKPRTFFIVGLSLGFLFQQHSMRSHKSSRILFGSSGRGGVCLLPDLARRISRLLERSENGGFSVMHSSISIANEYVSEAFEWTAPWLKNSMAVYLKTSPDIPVEVRFGLTSSEITAIPKSQICGLP